MPILGLRSGETHPALSRLRRSLRSGDMLPSVRVAIRPVGVASLPVGKGSRSVRGDFDGCFRYWESRSLGDNLKNTILQNSKTPSSESNSRWSIVVSRWSIVVGEGVW
jgi:hypothetical protein